MGTTLDAALAYLRAGLSVVPIARDGSKRPIVRWKVYQERLPTEVEVLDWFRGPMATPGVAIVCGAVSGDLELLDFDQEAGTIFPRWCALVEEECPGLVARLSVVKTPRPEGGYHPRYRCPDVPIPGNMDLAIDPTRLSKEQTLIQTRGEGGYALAPGCPPECHATGRTYEHHSGPKVSQIQTISGEEREILIRCARYFDRRAVAESPGLKPGEDFDRRGPDWPDILEPHGWRLTGQHGEERRWRRPGKEGNTWSATTGHCHGKDGMELLRVFSSNAAPFEAGKAYGKFRAWALLNHAGDWSAAARELAAQGYGGGTAQPKPAPAAPGLAEPDDKKNPPEPVLHRLSSVRPEPVPWLWPGWLPAGTLSMLDGDPGLGKSTLTLDLAARVSRGWRMPPEGGRDPGRDPAHVLLLGAEDSLRHTVRPRLDAAGADPDLVTSLDGFRVGEEVRDPVLPWDLRLLAGWIRENGVGLVIVDPLMAFLGGEYDAHKDQDIRRCLRPLRDLAEELSISVLLLRHLNKLNGGAALYRGGGSIAFLGAARASLVVGRDAQEPKRHVLAMNKINLGPMPTSLAYFIEPEGGVSRIVWEGTTALGRDDILWHATAATQAKEEVKQDDGEFFLRIQLANGPIAVAELQATAKAAGFTWKTIQNARAKLCIRAYKEGSMWFWEWRDD